MIFALTVDTEADNQWNHGAPLATENVRYWEPFQSICRKHGIPPTYLVTSEIASDRLAQALLGSWVTAGEAEVGAHLHPWTTPPFFEKAGFRFNDSWHAFLNELPENVIRSKLGTLTSQIQANFGIRPTAFRAGRFGFDYRSARILADLGYIVDSSVTPMTKWSAHRGLPEGTGGPDFTSHKAKPFIVEGTGEVGLVEIPVTVVPTYSLLRRFPVLLSLYRALPVRAARRALFRRWLSPQPVWLQPAVGDFRESDLERGYECQGRDSNVAVMIIHSSELMPAGSPSRPTAASVRELLELLDTFLDFIGSRGAIPATLSQAAIALRSSGSLESRAL